MDSNEIRELSRHLEICVTDKPRVNARIDEAAKALNAMADLVEAFGSLEVIGEPGDFRQVNKALTTIEEL